MKTEFIDISETEKNLVIEIPGDVVSATIERLTKDYGKAAKIPGFRPGKAPAQVVRKRYREQILHDVVHELVPRAVDEALRERGLEPVDTPNVKDVVVEEGRPLTFTAAFETVPPIDPGRVRGDYAAEDAGGGRRFGGRSGARAAARARGAVRTRGGSPGCAR